MAGALNLQDDRYKFLSDIFARLYTNATGQSLLFLVMDAGNFHHPKVCFGSSGFTVQDLPDTRLATGERTVAAKTLYARRGQEGFVVIYWMVIDRQRVDWTGQKVSQFWSSLLGKNRVGLIGRLDTPTSEAGVNAALAFANSFMPEIGRLLPAEQTAYLFGER